MILDIRERLVYFGYNFNTVERDISATGLILREGVLTTYDEYVPYYTKYNDKTSDAIADKERIIKYSKLLNLMLISHESFVSEDFTQKLSEIKQKQEFYDFISPKISDEVVIRRFERGVEREIRSMISGIEGIGVEDTCPGLILEGDHPHGVVFLHQPVSEKVTNMPESATELANPIGESTALIIRENVEEVEAVKKKNLVAGLITAPNRCISADLIRLFLSIEFYNADDAIGFVPLKTFNGMISKVCNIPGLQIGDKITHYNGKPLTSAGLLYSEELDWNVPISTQFVFQKPGTEVELRLIRHIDGKPPEPLVKKITLSKVYDYFNDMTRVVNNLIICDLYNKLHLEVFSILHTSTIAPIIVGVLDRDLRYLVGKQILNYTTTVQITAGYDIGLNVNPDIRALMFEDYRPGITVEDFKIDVIINQCPVTLVIKGA